MPIIRGAGGIHVFGLLSFSCSIGLLHSQAAPDQSLAAVREYTLNYSNSLPDYTCTRVTTRKDSPVILTLAEPELFDKAQPTFTASTLVIEEEVTVSQHRENYKVLKVDGQSYGHQIKLRPDQVISTISAAQFASVLYVIFDSKVGASIHFERRDKLRGQPVQVFSFEVPRAHGERVFDRAVNHEVTAAYKGRLYADAASNAVLRVETSASDFPSDSEFTGIDLTLDYKLAKIAGREFVLPDRFNLQWHRHLPNARTKAGAVPQESSVQAVYQDYRLVSAESSVTYSPEGEVHSSIAFGEAASSEKK